MAHKWTHEEVTDWIAQNFGAAYGVTLDVDAPDEIDKDGKDAIQYGAKFKFGDRVGKISWWENRLFRQVDVDHFVGTDEWEKEQPVVEWEVK